MDEQSESMLSNTTNPNIFAGGVQDDPLNMFREQSSDVLGKEFDNVEEAEEYYHKYSFIKGFSVRNDDLHKNKQGVVTRNKYAKNANRVRDAKGQTREGCRAAMRESDMSVVHSLKLVGVKTSQVMDHMVDMASGYASVSHMKKDLQNIIDVERRKLFSESDADAIIDYLTAKSEADTEYFYDYQLNEDGSLGNLFWADSMSRTDYRIFDDVLCFDTTYKTNAYKRPLVIFVGVNHHSKTTIFSFGLLITKTFLKAMHGKCPNSVVTYGDQVMCKAINQRWPRNAQTNLGNTDFTRAFSHFMVAFMTEIEFEIKWQVLIEKFGLHENAWVTKMYAKRKQWAETFLRDSFFGRIRSTQRSQSINVYLNRFLSSRLNLYEFMRQIDRAMARLRHTEAKDDFETLNERPVLLTHLASYEKQAAECTLGRYSSGIYDIVHRDELQTYTFCTWHGGNKTWDACWNETLSTLQCSCKLFESEGIPCRHTFGVLKARSISSIPPSLLITRWTMNAKAATDSEVPSDGTPDEIIKVGTFGTLSARCSKMCYFASDSTHGYEKAKMAIDSLCREIKSLKASTRADVGGTVPRPNDAHPIHIKNPPAATTKGFVWRTNKASAQPRKCERCR
ncbi:hypothetical protein ACOSQ4_012633 [Xanthoceras sorbifolium]